MSQRTRLVTSGAIAVLLILATLACSIAVAQEEDTQDQEQAEETPAQLKIGIVDFDVLSNEYQALAEKEAQLQGWFSNRASFLERLRNYAFLSEENFKEVLELLKVDPANRTEAQEKRREELKQLSESKERRFLDLRSKADRTTKEDDEFNTLSETFEARRTDINELAKESETEYRSRRDTIRADLAEKVQGIIATVSKEEGYDLILDSSIVLAQSDRITDVTEIVVQKLNKPSEAKEGENGGEG